jgi:hypothetical protein
MTTNADYTDIIAAFIDGEPVLPEALTDALARAEGRELLIELLALRDIVAIDWTAAAPAAASVSPRARPWFALASAAALALAAVGGYAAGMRHASDRMTALRAERVVDNPPAPTVVVTVDRWQETQKGGGS